MTEDHTLIPRRAGAASAALSTGAPPTAADVCRRMRLDPMARARLDDTMTPRAFVQTLLTAEMNVAAIEVVAQALPRRYGLWWGLLCQQHVTAARALTTAEVAHCRLILRWIRDPSEPTRTAAERAVQDSEDSSIASFLLTAAAQAPVGAGAPVVAGIGVGAGVRTGVDAGAEALATAVKLATLEVPREAFAATQRGFAMLGLKITLPAEVLAAPRSATTAQRRA